MLSGLLITLNILVCIALIGVVLLQRSEGGGFVSGGTGSLITARGAGDLLTRTTWVLFGLFMALSLSLTLLDAHDRTSSSVVEKLKLQRVNPAALGQTNSIPASPGSASPGPASPGPAAPGAAPFLGPPVTAPPAASTPAPSGAAAPAAHPARRAAPHAGGAAHPAPALVAPPPQPAPRTITAPPNAASAPAKPDPNAPVSTGTP